MSKRNLYRAFWVPSLVVIIGMVVMFSQQPLDVPEPTEMKRYTTGDKSLSVLHPGNWKGLATSAHAIETELTFEPARNIRIVFSADLQGSLMADMAKTPALPGMGEGTSEGTGLPGVEEIKVKQKSVVEVFHETQGKLLKTEYKEKSYKESKATPVQIAGKEAFFSEFSYEEPGVLGRTEMIGKRYTSLSGDRHLSIIYQCPQTSKDKIVPTFEKMVESLQSGEGG